MKLVLNNLTKEYGSQVAVKDLEYTMEKGVYGLLGTNGAGKTTLMRMICTLMKPSRGSITCDGKDIFEMGREYRCIIGYLPQDFGFYPDLSAREYLKYIADIKGLRLISYNSIAKMTYRADRKNNSKKSATAMERILKSNWFRSLDRQRNSTTVRVLRNTVLCSPPIIYVWRRLRER